MADHASLYHRLFSHPHMVAELLSEFAAGPWLDDLDLSAMQQAVQRAGQQAEQRGGATLPRRQLERRFGALPDCAQDRIAAADTAAQEEWGLRVLDAASLDDVLA